MLRRTLTLAAVVAAALPLTIAAAPPTGGPAANGTMQIDPEEQQDCTQFVPQRAGASGVTDEGQHVALDVRVLIDVAGAQDIALAQDDAGTDEERAAAQERFDDLVAQIEPQITAAQESYGPIDVDVAYTYEILSPYAEDGSVRDRDAHAAANAQGLIDLAKRQYGGERPADIDIVYVLTDHDIWLDFGPPVGESTAVAGLADCIGGVAWPDRAFAVGEIFPAIPIGPIEFYREGTAKILAHEVGHLMGAHHHYQDCGYHAAHEAQMGGFGACSLMTNAVDFQTTQFSVLSGAVVRGHAVDFADH